MPRPSFHRLTVAAVDRLCDDAAAVTFVIPDELAVAPSDEKLDEQWGAEEGEEQ